MPSIIKSTRVLLSALLLLCSLAAVAEPFVIKDIRVEGLQRISAGTVFNHLPVRVGETVESTETGEIIRALYKTGFFKDVRLEREGNVLIVFVAERPAISQINITGNESLEKEQLLQGLKDIGLAPGRVFNDSVLDKIEQELRRTYFDAGLYGVKLQSTVSPLERNRVSIDIVITEGEYARIKRINIVGNSAFDEDDLLDEFELGTTNWMSLVTKNDQYSRQKLSGDLETLRSYYLDRGYINFKVDSTQVSITPDKQDIYITININEGDVYTVSDVKLTGTKVAPTEEMFPLIRINRGDVFSRKEIVTSSEAISDLLGNKGYAFANVNSIPEIDEEKRQVALTFFVDPGKRVYVRRVNISGNANTRDEVLRREIRQMESAWFSTEKVNLSRSRLQRLGYFSDVSVETPAVPGSTDQVDVNIKVKEKETGSVMVGAGYSQAQGATLSASVSQSNFLGTGKIISFGLNTSKSNQLYQLGYTNPYWTVDGVSRGFNLKYKQTDFEEVGLADYGTNVMAGSVNFGFPINEFNRIWVDLGVSYTEFKVSQTGASQEVLAFEQDNGDEFLDYTIKAGWTYDTRDTHIFPTEGGLQKFYGQATIPGSDLTFYKVSFEHSHYFPLNDFFTFALNGEVGYGDGYGDTEELPFYENYFAGGIKSVRGYEGYSLGPVDSNNDPLGGNLKLVGNAELLFPEPFGIAPETIRLGLFYDIGNVYDTNGVNGDDIDLGELRQSAGASASWLSPFGAFTFALAAPLNDKSGDRTETFQFTYGSSF